MNRSPCLLLLAVYCPLHVQPFDVIVVGAGAGGLSTAWEAGRRGKRVAVVDMFSVFGGHAVISEGLLSLVDTPLQRSKGIADSPELAEKDFVSWGEDTEQRWVRLYVQRSREEIYDWLTHLGLQFHTVRQPPGNTVPRAHENPARGFGVVAPIYRDCLRYPSIEFLWNVEVTRLLQADGRVFGVVGRNARTRKEQRLEAPAVVLATGGYQSNATLLRSVWPVGVPFPQRILLGAGANALGSGLTLGREVGAVAVRLDHQWNYPWGVPDTRFPGQDRGLTVRNPASIWVNGRGVRFVNETLNARDSLKALFNQQSETYWMIFDEIGKRSLNVSGTDWIEFSRIERFILSAPEATSRAMSLEELSRQVGLPPGALTRAVERYNRLVEAGDDIDFHRFGKSAPPRILQMPMMLAEPTQIRVPPFYAVRGYPLARKSMGGLKIDLDCRVLNSAGLPIQGLYAVGEVAGFGGINGSAGLEGTFIGPALLQGKIVGRSVAAGQTPLPAQAVTAQKRSSGRAVCIGCHPLAQLVRRTRPGFYHFERSHVVVLERSLECQTCHAEMAPFRASDHKIDRTAQVEVCAACHLGTAGSQ